MVVVLTRKQTKEVALIPREAVAVADLTKTHTVTAARDIKTMISNNTTVEVVNIYQETDSITNIRR
jgi:hypothetical protein